MVEAKPTLATVVPDNVKAAPVEYKFKYPLICEAVIPERPKSLICVAKVAKVTPVIKLPLIVSVSPPVVIGLTAAARLVLLTV